jgi:hypothetical protein
MIDLDDYHTHNASIVRNTDEPPRLGVSRCDWLPLSWFSARSSRLAVANACRTRQNRCERLQKLKRPLGCDDSPKNDSSHELRRFS